MMRWLVSEQATEIERASKKCMRAVYKAFLCGKVFLKVRTKTSRRRIRPYTAICAKGGEWDFFFLFLLECAKKNFRMEILKRKG